MKNLYKLKVIFLIFTIFFTSEVAAGQILPAPKPTPDQETKIKTAQKKYIYPEKKPTLKQEKIGDRITFWMAHNAITTKNKHYFEERFAREEMGLAGVTFSPFKAWIDNWTLNGNNSLNDLILEGSGKDFSYYLICMDNVMSQKQVHPVSE